MKSFYILIFICLIILILIIMQLYYLIRKLMMFNNLIDTYEKNNIILNDNLKDKLIMSAPEEMFRLAKEQTNPELPLNVQTQYDPIIHLDRKMAFDPLEKQYKRPERHVIGDIGIRKYLNLATRGYPDNFHIIGTLTSEKHNDPNNKIIKLYGRQRQPNSTSTWDYYTMVTSGNDMVKIDLGEKRELFDGDQIDIPELSSQYKLKIYPTDIFHYNPFFI